MRAELRLSQLSRGVINSPLSYLETTRVHTVSSTVLLYYKKKVLQTAAQEVYSTVEVQQTVAQDCSHHSVGNRILASPNKSSIK